MEKNSSDIGCPEIFNQKYVVTYVGGNVQILSIKALLSLCMC